MTRGGIFKILILFNKDENKVNYLLCKNVFSIPHTGTTQKKTLIIVLAKRLMRDVYGYPNEGIPWFNIYIFKKNKIRVHQGFVSFFPNFLNENFKKMADMRGGNGVFHDKAMSRAYRSREVIKNCLTGKVHSKNKKKPADLGGNRRKLLWIRDWQRSKLKWEKPIEVRHREMI